MKTVTIPANWPCKCGVELCTSHVRAELSCPACGVLVEGLGILSLDFGNASMMPAKPRPATSGRAGGREMFDAEAHRRFMKSLH